MGWALAEEAARRGAKVTVVAANVGLPRAPGIEYVDVATAAELAAACRERFPAADVLLMAAAVADYRPADARADKIKKADAGATLALELERTEDVLTALAAERRPGQLLVGFAAEHGDAGGRARARQARAQAPRRRRRQRRLRARDRVRRAGQRGHDRHRGRGEPTSRGPPRRRSRRKFSTPC